jgi:hypothetical protein
VRPYLTNTHYKKGLVEWLRCWPCVQAPEQQKKKKKKKKAEDMNRKFSKKTHQWPINKHMKRSLTVFTIREWESNLQRDVTSHH